MKLRLSGAPPYSKAFLNIVQKAFLRHENALQVLFASTGALQHTASASMMVKMLKIKHETKRGKLNRPKLEPPPPRCSFCDKLLTKPLSCGQCKTARYCSRNCQRKDWKTHKKTCRPYQPPRRDKQLNDKFQKMVEEVLKGKGGGAGGGTEVVEKKAANVCGKKTEKCRDTTRDGQPKR